MEKESASTRFLYNTALGRTVLKLITRPWLSKAAGAFLSSAASRAFINGFVKKNGIDLSECESTDFGCFNDCFTRKLKVELRPVDTDPAALISPCDGLLSAYVIGDGLVVPVKQSQYSVADLLGKGRVPEAFGTYHAGALAKSFEGGLCLVFRLRVQDYHRYAFFDSGLAHEPVKIPGLLHTVRPIALRSVPVFTENSREVTIIDSENFGRCAQIEVGALMVGKIGNHPLPYREAGSGAPKVASVAKGAEKGRFLFGGSTIILLIQKDRAEGLSQALAATSEGRETPVKLGQRIGTTGCFCGAQVRPGSSCGA